MPTAALLAAGLALTACSGDAGAGDDDAASATHEIEDYFGDVEIPSDPQRVVAGDSVTLANLLSLGVTPVASPVNPNSLPTYLADRMEDVVLVGDNSELDWEKVLAQDPDLFITFAGFEDDPWNQETYDKAAEALPTFGYVYNYVHLDEIKKNFTEVARALGEEETADARLEQLDDRLAELKARVAAADLTDQPVSTLRVSADGSYSIRIGTSESIAFRALGIAQPEGQTDPDDFSIDVSEENLDLLDSADMLFVYVDDTADGERERIESSPLWERLPAVENDRVHFVSSGVWNSVDIDGFELILDDIEELFLAPAE